MPPSHLQPRLEESAIAGVSRRQLAAAWVMHVALAPGAWASPVTVKVATGEWPPFMSEALPEQGFVLQIVREAFAQEGIQVEFAFFPWARAMLQVEAGTSVASAAWYVTAERAQKFHFSAPLFVEQQVLFHRRSEPLAWKTLDDLKGKRIGATTGYVYGEAFQEAEKTGRLTVDRAPSDDKNLRKLLLGRVDAVAMSLAVGLDLLRRVIPAQEAATLTYFPRPLNAGPLHLVFAKSAKGLEWQQLFDRGLAKLQKSGRLNAIIAATL
ncbi:substrate-binding periplasmic protein [Inhella gelatinilytica]|uniref:Amino acid ABC transporter substrate-binding protein n=1 Tax=Inhella gelatinilytica TaxID=2795030 RepID=A0A931IXJ4_9BURK|nr:transporter substrate-binding domain-containing protein [Inhella gelatinilytica]MBH9552855.1 amino acid ABC transporter substrate-binding protein [Inhella gelatinilytica]